MSGNAGLALGIGSAAGTFANAYAQSRALEAKAEHDKIEAEFSVAMSRLQEKDAIERGQEAQKQRGIQGAQLIAEQRVAAAASGVEVNSGSAFYIQQDTRRQIRDDLTTIANNAWREAWGYKAAGLSAKYSSLFNTSAAKFAAQNTLIAGGLQGLGQVGQGYYADYSNSAKRSSLPVDTKEKV